MTESLTVFIPVTNLWLRDFVSLYIPLPLPTHITQAPMVTTSPFLLKWLLSFPSVCIYVHICMHVCMLYPDTDKMQIECNVYFTCWVNVLKLYISHSAVFCPKHYFSLFLHQMQRKLHEIWSQKPGVWTPDLLFITDGAFSLWDSFFSFVHDDGKTILTLYT